MKELMWLCAGALAAFPVRSHRPAPRPSGEGATRSPDPPTAPSATAPGAFDWRDAVLYFVVVDRFGDGNGGNNVNVDRTGRGAFHGGDLQGLRERLDDTADLGVTALWVTPS